MVMGLAGIFWGVGIGGDMDIRFQEWQSDVLPRLHGIFINIMRETCV